LILSFLPTFEARLAVCRLSAQLLLSTHHYRCPVYCAVPEPSYCSQHTTTAPRYGILCRPSAQLLLSTHHYRSPVWYTVPSLSPVTALNTPLPLPGILCRPSAELFLSTHHYHSQVYCAVPQPSYCSQHTTTAPRYMVPSLSPVTPLNTPLPLPGILCRPSAQLLLSTHHYRSPVHCTVAQQIAQFNIMSPLRAAL
jgi:hypothetical protein